VIHRKRIKALQGASISSQEAYRRLIRRIKESAKKRRITFFCGAGISRQSGLPLAIDLKSRLLATLPLSRTDRQYLIKSRLPLELILQTLAESTGSIKRVLDIFKLGRPNATHYFIANLIKARLLKCLITTNFDRLIERACELSSVKQDHDFRVCYGKRRMRTLGTGRTAALIHIHGSVDDRASLAATLRVVASRTFERARQRILRQAFTSKSSQDHVIVLGYSWSDVFDISPIVAQLRSRASVLLVSHSSIVSPQLVGLATLPVRHPLRRYSGRMLKIDTNRFVHDLSCGLCLGSAILPTRPTASVWTKVVNNWAKRNSRAQRCLAAANLLRQAGRNAHSAKYLNRALRAAQRAKNHHLQIKILGAKGNLNRTLARYRIAANCFAKIVAHARRRRQHRLLSQALRDLATVVREEGDLLYAKRLNDEALRIARIAGDRSGIAYALSCRASLLSVRRAYAQAARGHLGAARSLAAIGDVRAQAAALVDASGALIEICEVKTAARYLRQAETLASNCGDLRVLVTVLIALGSLARVTGARTAAMIWLKRAADLAHMLGQRGHEAIALGALAGAMLDIAEKRLATEYLRRALSIARMMSSVRLEMIVREKSSPLRRSQRRENGNLRRSLNSLASSDAKGGSSNKSSAT
jgi:NAD-dependent SIR2 family protein deacetylase/tetratricopeptide (TPR) repeat protein